MSQAPYPGGSSGSERRAYNSYNDRMHIGHLLLLINLC